MKPLPLTYGRTVDESPAASDISSRGCEQLQDSCDHHERHVLLKKIVRTVTKESSLELFMSERSRGE